MLSRRGLSHLHTDPILSAVITRVGPIKFRPRRLPPYQSLMQAIIYQQLSGKAAETILGRFEALFGNGAFPRPEAVLKMDITKLRSAGLSGQKVNYIRDVAQKTLDGVVPQLEACDSLSDAELVERFTSIKGVGRWTVEMLLIFNLGRPDVWPVHDLGIRKGYQIAFRKRALPAPERLELWGKKWSPYRSIAALYLWRAADLKKEEKKR